MNSYSHAMSETQDDRFVPAPLLTNGRDRHLNPAVSETAATTTEPRQQPNYDNNRTTATTECGSSRPPAAIVEGKQRGYTMRRNIASKAMGFAITVPDRVCRN
jgi:hypothetical protein